jgi:hypothetical protein
MDQATLDALVGRRELEELLSLRPTQVALILRTPEWFFPEPVKVLEDGTRLWDVAEVLGWNDVRTARRP